MAREDTSGGLLLKWWQVIVFLGGFAVQAGEARVTLSRVEADVRATSETVRAHLDGPGHPLANERIEQLRVEQARLTLVLTQINERLGKIDANLIRLCSRSNAGCRE